MSRITFVDARESTIYHSGRDQHNNINCEQTLLHINSLYVA
jgi:hypothetical protein